MAEKRRSADRVPPDNGTAPSRLINRLISLLPDPCHHAAPPPVTVNAPVSGFRRRLPHPAPGYNRIPCDAPAIAGNGTTTRGTMTCAVHTGVCTAGYPAMHHAAKRHLQVLVNPTPFSPEITTFPSLRLPIKPREDALRAGGKGPFRDPGDRLCSVVLPMPKQ